MHLKAAAQNADVEQEIDEQEMSTVSTRSAGTKVSSRVSARARPGPPVAVGAASSANAGAGAATSASMRRSTSHLVTDADDDEDDEKREKTERELALERFEREKGLGDFAKPAFGKK